MPRLRMYGFLPPLHLFAFMLFQQRNDIKFISHGRLFSKTFIKFCLLVAGDYYSPVIST
jgi:hypothetical protein